MKNNIKIIALFFLVSTTATAQWTKGKGNGYYKLSAWSLSGNKLYTDGGEIAKLPATRKTFNTSIYAEYGLTDKIDLLAYIPFFTRSTQNNNVSKTRGNITNEGAALNSFGDTDIGIRYGLLKNNTLALSSMLKLGIPLGDTSGGHESAVLQNGDGEFNQHLQFDLGIPFKIATIGGYAKTFVAYNQRTKGFSDEIYYGGEIGFNFFQKLWLIGKLNILKSTKNGDDILDSGNGSLFANNIEYTNIGFGAAYYIRKKIGLSYEYSTATSGRIIAAAPSHSVGVFLDLK